MTQILFIGAMLVLMWVLLIQPQRRRRQEQARLLADLQTGDEVITIGGLYGRVQSLDGDSVQLEVAPQTSVRVAKTAVATKVAPQSPEPDAATLEGRES